MNTRTKARIIRNALRFSCLKESVEFNNACRFPLYTQARTLRSILSASVDTVFGREHHFDEILQAKDEFELIRRYRQFVPVVEYEDVRPYVKRMMSGESDVLIKGKPVMYATTSGSTGEPKYIPISKSYLDKVYFGMTNILALTYSKLRMRCFSGYILTIVGKTEEGRAEDGTPVGSASGLTSGSTKGFINRMYAVPKEVFSIEDYSSRYYTLMRFAIEKNVTLWVTPNPSTVLEMQSVVDNHLDDFIKDIGEGTINKDIIIEPEIRATLEKNLKPNPSRAYELRRLQSTYERVLPRHYWPKLKMLSTWKCGNTHIYLSKIHDFFSPSVVHHEFGYFASECRAGLVVDRSNESVLFPNKHFFEFKKEKDLGNPSAPFLRLDELKEGERYCPYVTTWSGLFRYNLNDIVQVASRYKRAPRVHMVQKVNGIVSITGEKLYEDQFIKAVDAAQESTGMKLLYYAGYVNLQESRYDWYFEFEDSRINQKRSETFAKVVDDNLKRMNIEYESKRNSFRLKDPAVYLLVPNAFAKFKKFIISRNHRDASRFKPNVLAQNEENHSVIKKFIKTGKKKQTD